MGFFLRSYGAVWGLGFRVLGAVGFQVLGVRDVGVLGLGSEL